METKPEKKITAPDIIRRKEQGRRIPMLTAYGFSMAALLDRAGVDIVLVGDSLGMVEAGLGSTLPVTMEDIIYHTRAVSRGVKRALVVADMPFLSYQPSTRDAILNAGRLVKEGGAQAVKLEGGSRSCAAIEAIVEMGVPVMGHIGLTPQSVNALGGYRVQGKVTTEAEQIIKDARAVQEAGAFSIVLECIPASLATEITASLTIPTIGIGAGPHCDGQVLVINDMLGLGPDEASARFVRKYADLNTVILTAVERFNRDVIQGVFPSDEESYS